MNDLETSSLAYFICISKAQELAYEKREDLRWEQSPFKWIKKLSSIKAKGKVFEILLSLYVEGCGILVKPRSGSGHDRRFDDAKTEIKGALLGIDGTFTFNQVRDQDYEYLTLLGLTPTEAYLWIVPKSEVKDQWGTGLPFQHGGKKGVDTTWISKMLPDNPPYWLQPWGGRLDQGLKVLHKELNKRNVNHNQTGGKPNSSQGDAI